jgi:hypothetical protein
MSPAVPSGVLNSSLGRVSCAAATACLAIGTEQPNAGEALPMAERWNGSTWIVDVLPIRSSDRFTFLGVSCASPTDCVAAGYADMGRTSHVVVDRWNGVAWTAQRMPEPPGSMSTEVSGISCSAGGCTAVGRFKEGTGLPYRYRNRTLAERSAP